MSLTDDAFALSQSYFFCRDCITQHGRQKSYLHFGGEMLAEVLSQSVVCSSTYNMSVWMLQLVLFLPAVLVACFFVEEKLLTKLH